LVRFQVSSNRNNFGQFGSRSRVTELPEVTKIRLNKKFGQYSNPRYITVVKPQPYLRSPNPTATHTRPPPCRLLLKLSASHASLGPFHTCAASSLPRSSNRCRPSLKSAAAPPPIPSGSNGGASSNPRRGRRRRLQSSQLPAEVDMRLQFLLAVISILTATPILLVAASTTACSSPLPFLSHDETRQTERSGKKGSICALFMLICDDLYLVHLDFC
jgi:hypothetical protein